MRLDSSRYAARARWSSALAGLVGLWLIVCPFILGFFQPEHGLGSSAWLAATVFVAFGLAIAGVAAFHASAAHRPMWPTLVLLAIGAVVFLSPMFLRITGNIGADASAIIVGSLVAALGVSGAVYTTPAAAPTA